MPFRHLCHALWSLAVLGLFTFPVCAADAPAPEERPWFHTYNQIMFSLNQFVYRQLDQASEPAGMPASEPSPVLQGIGNMAANIVNEPMSVIAATVSGDADGAWRATQRFAINSTVGILGFKDVAREWGLEPYHTDLGLALCAAGVPEGPYMVFPFVGPRTLRDGVVDIGLTNIIMYTMFAPLLPVAPGISTIVVVESVELAADLAVTRQIDPKAKAMDFHDFDRLREQYLAQRRQRCAEVRAELSLPGAES